MPEALSDGRCRVIFDAWPEVLADAGCREPASLSP